MHRSTAFQHTLPNLFPKTVRRRRTDGLALRRWTRPTFGEFLRQVEHEFGDGVDTTGLFLTRADRDEPLTPGSVRELCELLGIPPEDFGV